MSAIFLYEDGQGEIYDQSGNDAMDLELEEDVNSFHLETLINVRRYCESQGQEEESLMKDLVTRMENVANLAEKINNTLHIITTVMSKNFFSCIITE